MRRKMHIMQVPHMIIELLGQGAFRVVVTNAYQRRCAFTGEKMPPVLQEAHIKPYATEGPHSVNNLNP